MFSCFRLWLFGFLWFCQNRFEPRVDSVVAFFSMPSDQLAALLEEDVGNHSLGMQSDQLALRTAVCGQGHDKAIIRKAE